MHFYLSPPEKRVGCRVVCRALPRNNRAKLSNELAGRGPHLLGPARRVTSVHLRAVHTRELLLALEGVHTPNCSTDEGEEGGEAQRTTGKAGVRSSKHRGHRLRRPAMIGIKTLRARRNQNRRAGRRPADYRS